MTHNATKSQYSRSVRVATSRWDSPAIRLVSLLESIRKLFIGQVDGGSVIVRLDQIEIR